MSSAWRKTLKASVTPLDRGVRGLRVHPLRTPEQALERPGRTAAVLVGVVQSQSPEILLTKRSEQLKQHAGQISFPGGAVGEPGESGVVTALREAHEEIGLHPEAVQPIGFLDRVDTVSDFRVLPVVGLVSQAGPGSS